MKNAIHPDDGRSVGFFFQTRPVTANGVELPHKANMLAVNLLIGIQVAGQQKIHNLTTIPACMAGRRHSPNSDVVVEQILEVDKRE